MRLWSNFRKCFFVVCMCVRVEEQYIIILIPDYFICSLLPSFNGYEQVSVAECFRLSWQWWVPWGFQGMRHWRQRSSFMDRSSEFPDIHIYLMEIGRVTLGDSILNWGENYEEKLEIGVHSTRSGPPSLFPILGSAWAKTLLERVNIDRS